MPKQRTDDAVHVIMTDHMIQRLKPSGDPLAPRPEKVERFGENGIAGFPGRGHTRGLRHCPPMVTVATAQQRDHEPGVNEDACGHTPSS